MANTCPITKKSTKVVGGYSNRIRATQFNPTGSNRAKPNLQKKKVYVPELKKYVTVTASTKGLKTILKNGPYSTLKKAGLI